jgi:hypothetical protein
MLAPFTSNDDVRAVFGVTSDELTDATLELGLYERNLRLELDLILNNGGTLIEAFETVSAIPENTRTAAQENLYSAVLLFSPYPVALHLASSLPLFAPKSITDGKAAISRHSESPFEKQIQEARQYYERFRQNLISRWATYGSSTSAAPLMPTLFSVSSPDTDPVTGT